MHTYSVSAFIAGLLFILVCGMSVPYAFAQTPSSVQTLQDQIDDKNSQLTEIDKQIAQYEADLKKVGAQKDTLQKAINQLELQHKKIATDISYTQTKISATDLQLNKLSQQMGTTQESIDTDKRAIGRILQTIRVTDNVSMMDMFLQNENVADFWNTVATLEHVRSSISDKMNSLSALQSNLADQKDATTMQRTQLVNLKSQYNDQVSILDDNTSKKAELLSTTKDQESKYQKMLAEQNAARDQLQAEVTEIESKIKFILDPTSIPPAGTAVFKWPLDNVRITQYFGNTQFAQTGAYDGKGHNGIDLGAPIGTIIHAPLSGTVRATGNTDLVPGCYSWGKWVLLDHPNGLSSLFAHLSKISVVPGQKLNTGDLVGYTGATGYVTGPHLHYTVYVQSAVQLKKFNEFKTITNCGPAESPFAALAAYLNPIDYLPPVP